MRLLISYGLWSGLGAYRGFQDYNKEYNKKNKYYMKNPNSKKPEFYFTQFFLNTMVGFLVYANPLSAPFFIVHELYGIEEKIRGIKNEEEEKD